MSIIIRLCYQIGPGHRSWTNGFGRRRNMSGGRVWAVARIGVLALLWGSTFLWIKLALHALAPVQVTLARCVFGSLALLAVCLKAGRRLPHGRAAWGHIVVAALFCNALPFAMFSVGEQTVDSGV